VLELPAIRRLHAQPITAFSWGRICLSVMNLS
jgi:hypothetical protein